MTGRHRAERARSELRGELCGETHPEREEVRCDKHAPCWGDHSNVEHMTVWPGRPVPSRRPRTVEMAGIANRTARNRRPAP